MAGDKRRGCWSEALVLCTVGAWQGDRRVTAVQFLTDTTGDLRLVCGGEEPACRSGGVCVGDEEPQKHKAEVMAVTVSATLDANFVVAGDRQGRISAWERDAYGKLDWS
ncbi:hypothetical protein GQ600_13938 [Phytophthora cactorum]|nr:hypothetical protein GQ600_13938 [Phytophthora cactorum]